MARRTAASLDQLHLEDQHRVGRDIRAGAAFAVTELGRDLQPADAAGLHPRDTQAPALDDLIETKGDRLACQSWNRTACRWSASLCSGR